ncbi:MAG TPA: M48 family metallopeptidase [Candidatus Sulfotelmatobacter sp.]|nr:M48 family metallopeptidase [Candidatus Sulfotelmatobacter sp.]
MKHTAALASSLALFLVLEQPVLARPDDQVRNDDSQRTSQQKPKVKPGSKDDVDAIGNRDVGGGRGLGNWYSLETEIRLGREYAQMIDTTVKLVQDPVITEYVNRIGQNIVRNSDARVPFTIKVIDSDEVNAFALPGGFFYVNTGLLLVADEEAELAGVMAHEVAHVAARHAMRQMTRGNLANIASIPLIFVGGGIGYAARSAAGIGVPMSFMKFSRGFEEEADYLGLQYMYKAGYDPQSFLTFFEKLQAKEKKKPGTLSNVFASHPPLESRVSKIQRQTDTKLPSRLHYVVTTSEFDDVRSRLAVLENRGKVNDDKKEKRPSLRRVPNKSDESTAEDDRPTLKRRETYSD